ncbi:MAG: hypothetical protein N4A54_00190 [Peptostreptococcaceae bacterium]|jgi:uncharacterized FAD-dependent dehydrogenase|nr:hypothetical protein [Peptostreptococcaceae bacterium]
MLRISNLKLNISEDKSLLEKKIIKKLKIKKDEIIEYEIYKESIDARKNDINFIYTIDIKLMDENKILSNKKIKDVKEALEYKYEDVKEGSLNLENKPVVVGFGPAGLFCALMLSYRGYKPIVLEQGEDVDNRSKTVERFLKEGKLNEFSNVQFGEGGAGTFSDGKLTSRSKDKRGIKVLDEFVKANAPKEILYKAKPHIGTDILKNVVKTMRKTIIENGGQIIFNSKVKDFKIEDNKIKGVYYNEEFINTDTLVLATGHSCRDIYKKLYERNFELIQKPLAIGLRIEHPQILINKSQYKEHFDNEKLSSAEYHLTYKTKDEKRSVYTFCMCPGGVVINSTSSKECLVVNGMSEHKRDKENANSALLVNIKTSDFNSENPLAGIYFQEEFENKAFILGGSNYNVPVQRVKDFIDGVESKELGNVKPTVTPNYKLTNLKDCLPDFVYNSLKEGIINLDEKLKGFALEDAILTGIETRSSSPIRIKRDNESLESTNIKNFYPCGEGAGYAGGIISSAIDGIKIAEKIISKYKPID